MSREDFEHMRGAATDRHAQWNDEHRQLLRASGLAFIERETAVLFRESGKPQVDFFPHSGRWRIVGKGAPNKTFRGGAAAFLAWYAKETL